MQVELGELIGQGEERENTYHCVEARLDQLSGIVDAAEISGKLAPLGLVALPPWRTWPRGIWASTVSAQTASHLDRDLLDNYSSAYAFADNLSTLSLREVDISTALTTLVGPGQAFSTAEAVAVAFDLGYDLGSAREYSERALSAYKICGPIGSTPPASYGQAPFETLITDAHKTPITREDGGGAKR